MNHAEQTTEFIYVYGIIPKEEAEKREVPFFSGIDQSNITIKVYKEIAAVVSLVDGGRFSQQQLDVNLHDPHWLQENALHHHEIIVDLNKYFTILPMSFCTIFKDEKNLEHMLDQRYEMVVKKINLLNRKQEWNLKVFCVEALMKKEIELSHPTVISIKEQITNMTPGKQYLMKKRLSNLVTSEIENEKIKHWNDINSRLQRIAADHTIRKILKQEITGRQEEMIYNCDYLLDENEVEGFISCIRDFEKVYQKWGWIFELTGPWPPYHFAKISTGDQSD